MSVATEIKRLSTNIKNALTALTEKGVDVPTGANSNNLAELISTIETGGGGAEIKTCTVKFEPYSASDGWETIEGAHYYGQHVYTKCVDGVISTVTEYGNSGTSYDITLENVVCGSLIWFDVNAETYDPSDLNGGEWLDNFTTLFIAPPEAGAVCVFRMGVPGESDW